VAAITWSNVTAIVPGLSSIAVEVSDAILEWVNAQVASSAWGGDDSVRYKMVRVFLAAHLATLGPWSTGGVGVSGRVTSKTMSATSASVTYQQKLTTEALQMTEWGQMYAWMIRGNARARMPVTW
jgi:uncharacterized protein DUF4054